MAAYIVQTRNSLLYEVLVTLAARTGSTGYDAVKSDTRYISEDL